MSTIKFKHTIQETKEIEVEFPCYRKRGIFFWKILSENETICVDVSLTTGCSIIQAPFISKNAFDEVSEESNEQEFFMMYNEIKDKLYARTTSI